MKKTKISLISLALIGVVTQAATFKAVINLSYENTAVEDLIPEDLAPDELANKILPDESDDWGSFGISIAIDNGVYAVGAPRRTGGGAIYIYEKKNGILEIKEKITSATANSQLGTVLSLDGNYLAAGDDDDGRVFIYEKVGGNWSFKQTFVSDGGDAGYAMALKLKGDKLLVSGGYDNTFYLYENQSGTWVQTLKTGDVKVDAVEMSDDGNELYIGSSEIRNSNDETVGGVRVYSNESGSWEIKKTLSVDVDNVNGPFFDRVGTSLTTSENYLVAGAYTTTTDMDNGGQEGGVIVYKKTAGEWAIHQEIISETPRTYSYFGKSVALSNNNLIISSPARSDEDWTFGYYGIVDLYSLEGDQFKHKKEFGAPEKVSDASFGSGIDIDGSEMLIGSSGDNDYNGASYYFD